MNQVWRWSWVLAAGCGIVAGGCRSGGGQSAARPEPEADRLVAIVDGQPVGWRDLRGGLAEAAGGAVLEELVLDVRLARDLQRAGLTVTDEAVQRERQLLADNIASTSGVGADDAERMLANLRRERGLGDERFAALLRRNAGLRALVRSDVRVSEEHVRRAYELRHGARARVRVIVTESAAAAAEVRNELGPTPSRERVSEAASRKSIDESAARGGLLDPISAADPTVDAALRRVVEQLRVGELSPPLALARGHAVAWLEERIAGDSRPLAGVREELVRQETLAQERTLMDRLARRLVAEGPPTVMDRSLNWGWESRQRP